LEKFKFESKNGKNNNSPIEFHEEPKIIEFQEDEGIESPPPVATKQLPVATQLPVSSHAVTTSCSVILTRMNLKTEKLKFEPKIEKKLIKCLKCEYKGRLYIKGVYYFITKNVLVEKIIELLKHIRTTHGNEFVTKYRIRKTKLLPVRCSECQYCFTRKETFKKHLTARFPDEPKYTKCQRFSKNVRKMYRHRNKSKISTDTNDIIHFQGICYIILRGIG